MDVANTLAEYVGACRHATLPKEVVDTTKKFILDTIATTMAGSSEPSCREVVNLIREWGGKEESSILVFGDRVPAVHAAFLNSMMAHALDFDDNYAYDLQTRKKNGGHANITAVPAALAVAELKGSVSGKEFITAVALGVDLMLRLTFAAKGGRGWTRSAICGVFGAAATASYLLQLSEAEILNAFGLAYSQASGNQQAIIDKSLVKRMQPAFAAQAGVFAALLAQRGLSGARDIFQGKFGFFQLYSNGEYDLQAIFQDLGTKYEGMNLGIKPYPCGRLIHPAIDGMLEMMEQYNLKAEEIVEILVHAPERTVDLVGAPFKIGEDFKVRAQFSIPYGVAVAIVRGGVSMEDFFEDERIRDSAVEAVAQRIRVVADPDLEYAAKIPVALEVLTKTRGTLSKTIDRMKGDPGWPLTDDEFHAKIVACAKYADKPEMSANVENIIHTVEHLDEAESLSPLVSLLGPSRR